MKWLIFGYNGWIGKQIIKILNDKNEEIIFANCRADNINDVEKIIINSCPDRVISVIGRTHGDEIKTIDYLEQKGKLVENINDNLFSPMILAFVCSKYNIHLTYMGTGCIFSGYDKEYDENDLPDFFGSSYSVVKGYTDRLIKNFTNILNVRIRMPISEDLNNDRNFIYKITHYKKTVNDHVLDEQENISIDKHIEIKRIVMDHVALESELWSGRFFPVYMHKSNNEPYFIQPNLYLGHNGTWQLEFITPATTWLINLRQPGPDLTNTIFQTNQEMLDQAKNFFKDLPDV